MLQVNQQTDEQTQQEQTRKGELAKSITDNLLNSNVMKTSLADIGFSPKTEEVKEPVKKTEEEKPKQEKEVETEEEVVETEAETEEVEAEEDEEVIPKSKVQKRFDELTAKNKYLEQQIEELKNTKSPEPKDEIAKQLEAMTTEQLKAAKLEVRKAQIRAHDDDAKLNELLALEDRIDNVMQDAPKNFAKQQTEEFNKAAQRIAASGDVLDLETASPKILKLAQEIYNEYPMLQRDVKGQAAALDMAVKHYKAMNNNPPVIGDKTKEVELKRQVNTLKRKTTLDTKTGNSSLDKAKNDTLIKNAIGGTERQKVSLVRSHPMFNVDAMIPDEFKEK